jgi:hypothetical protein
VGFYFLPRTAGVRVFLISREPRVQQCLFRVGQRIARVKPCLAIQFRELSADFLTLCRSKFGQFGQNLSFA